MLIGLERLVDGLKNGMGIWYIVLINFIGAVAILIKATELQQKKRDNILKYYIVNATLWVIYFLLNADLVSALTCLFGLAQGLIFLQRGKKKWASGVWWLIIFIAVQIASFIIFYKQWHDVFCLMAGILGIVAYYMLKEKNYRLFMFLCLLAWVLNSVFKLYYIAIIHDALGLISAMVAIIRYDIIKVKKQEEILTKQ